MFIQPFGESERANFRLQYGDLTRAERSVTDFHSRNLLEGFSGKQTGGGFKFDTYSGDDTDIGKLGGDCFTHYVSPATRAAQPILANARPTPLFQAPVHQ